MSLVKYSSTNTKTMLKSPIMTLHGHKSHVLSLEFYQNILATASFDSTVMLWDISTAQNIQTFANLHQKNSAILDIHFIDNGESLVSLGADRSIAVLNLQTGISASQCQLML
jgi:F-box and WD-40 domain protein MET30